MKDLKEEFEQIYSLSIRRGEDSATVWEWLNETYSKQLHKPDVSGALPALDGLSEYINNSYDFVDGDWYWKIDVEGDCPLSIEQVIANFISRQ